MKALPERIRLSFTDDSRGSTPLPLPRRRMWPAGVVFGALFVMFAAIALEQIASLNVGTMDDVFDLVSQLFSLFWVLAWSAGVLILFLITVVLFTYRESAHLSRSRLVHVPRLGPLKVIAEYQLAKIRNLRTVNAAEPGRVTLRFEYGNGDIALGNAMTPAEAESRIHTIRDAIERARSAAPRGGAAALETPEPGLDVTRWLRRGLTTRAAPAPKEPPRAQPSADTPGLTSASVVALLGANIVPLAGLVLFDWELGEIMVLFWAENAVIGVYNLLRLAVVAKWAVLFVGPFFVGHYGGFMVGHFMFVYYLFVRGIDDATPEPGPWEALGDVFVPLWPALLALFVSHGLSFYTNFLRGREFAGRTVGEQMGEPYKRVFVMHVTLIFGGWIILLLGQPVGGLALLIALKTAVDVRAHRKEHS